MDFNKFTMAFSFQNMAEPETALSLNHFKSQYETHNYSLKSDVK